MEYKFLTLAECVAELERREETQVELRFGFYKPEDVTGANWEPERNKIMMINHLFNGRSFIIGEDNIGIIYCDTVNQEHTILDCLIELCVIIFKRQYSSNDYLCIFN